MRGRRGSERGGRREEHKMVVEAVRFEKRLSLFLILPKKGTGF